MGRGRAEGTKRGTPQGPAQGSRLQQEGLEEQELKRSRGSCEDSGDHITCLKEWGDANAGGPRAPPVIDLLSESSWLGEPHTHMLGHLV